MKGGFNKILRNIVAGANDTEFEKVSKQVLGAPKPNSLLLVRTETHKGDIPPRLEGAQGEARNL
jgi:hypothetical protein